ncbi:MAG: triose-phosphate isomerase [Candidatus Wildermuthbacteria bacterium RIFCSPHIGHO2_01_FULL_45_20]|uniref:Triosephosphate isomerase n=1 Tax=Candidatus Wildermuthbacteria bacterium RIFCSPHIGHO2_02_FULL_45_25 TaxID=1802450 RepID=A0A1G2R4Z6_9BACT|nr:MAG: triose-phosphate isomerase [Candidatus Wildermuthbacteria bacterium RIFCSPHIGHO2_01_FULL_45_20]OHA67934.1 MAG: triose-phosphate isomerase [Candidatus Wildermuthbacteria bacterium RIFCSPHIGHO2_02_FULL_45_25]
MKKTLIVANWKMYPLDEDVAVELATKVEQGIKNVEGVEVALCPPFVYLIEIKKHLAKASLGAQNTFWEQEGAYTGEISPAMLKKLGCSYVILGHSERKNFLGETPEMINQKVRAVLAAKLIPVVCIGEKKRLKGAIRAELEWQMKGIFKDIPSSAISKIVLAYEPEWAISSQVHAQPATPQDCKETISFMRDALKGLWDETIAKNMTILYGGSVNSSNIKEFLLEGNAQGALVGFASLEAEEFIKLVGNLIK